MPKTVNPFQKAGEVVEVGRADDKGTVYIYDSQHRVSLYTDNLYPIIKILSPNGLRLLMWTVCHLRRQQDYKAITFRAVNQDTGLMSRNTFFRAISELTTHGVIARRTKGTYWINPFLFFNGNRVRYAFDNNLAKITEHHEQ